MLKNEKEILSQFVADGACSAEELARLKRWLTEDGSQSEIGKLFLKEWEEKDEKETSVEFQDIQNRIANHQIGKKNPGNPGYRKIVHNYRKVAAVLLIPALFISTLFVLRQFNTETFWFRTAAAFGQKSHLILPDGTQVWLNSGSEISYSDAFGKKDRNVLLTGEAYFEVTKNAHKPFLVKAGEEVVKVLGTRFNIKAYSDETEIETTLFEGKIELSIHPLEKNIQPRIIAMKPGESLIYNKTENKLRYNNFQNDEVEGWKNNQLIFRNDNFEHLVKKIERWYDVEIIYDKEKLNEERLTVELYQGELLNKLLDIIELAMNVECVSEKDKIYIKTREK